MEYHNEQMQQDVNTVENREQNFNTAQKPKPVKNDYGLISMICGISGICFSGTFIISIVLGIVAIVLSNKATDPDEESYKKIGKITGIISIAISAVITILMITLFIGLCIGDLGDTMAY